MANTKEAKSFRKLFKEKYYELKASIDLYGWENENTKIALREVWVCEEIAEQVFVIDYEKLEDKWGKEYRKEKKEFERLIGNE